MKSVKFPKLFEPAWIGTLRVKNRLVMPPCTTNFAGPSGEVTDRLIKYYAERARGGVGTIIIENSQVKYPEGKNVSCQLRLDNDKFIPGYQELAEAIHTYGAKVIQQIHHAGRQVHNTEGVAPKAPSAIPCGFLQIPVKELSNEEVWDLIERFSETALRVKKAGMDGVEFHGAHGYLIGEFMSPHTNQRVDEFGGSFERRMKFILEIIKRTREKVGPAFVLDVRYSADEFVAGGLTIEDGKKIAVVLEAAGVNILNITSGIYESMPTLLEPMRYEEGWRVYLAEEIKKVVKIPVITVGQIKTPAFAEKILEDGRADFVALGRPLIADPDWPIKAADGRENEIRKCISCNIGCIGGHVFFDRYMRCTVNAVVGHEREPGWLNLEPANKKKKVMVVGGGPGGMEAARIAALRGHEVTLYEKEPELGGQLKIGAVPPGKEKVKFVAEYLSGQLEKVGVRVERGKEVDEDFIKNSAPDVVIVATGAQPIVPEYCCSLGRNVLSYFDVLSGGVKIEGKNVVIAGGGTVACETALYLEEQGNKVTIVEMLPELATDMEPISRFDLLTNCMPKSGIKTLTKLTITAISNDGVTTVDPWGKMTFLPADCVVVAIGTKPLDDLSEKIEDFVREVYVIGDGVKSRKILDAVYEGARVARLI